jgi:hypothetical protein
MDVRVAALSPRRHAYRAAFEAALGTVIPVVRARRGRGGAAAAAGEQQENDKGPHAAHSQSSQQRHL